ncbi:MAG: hypothetical protein G3W61_22675, partial [Xanthomonas perforans]|nr:hypothetical protein [Xanthomonas perforans]
MVIYDQGTGAQILSISIPSTSQTACTSVQPPPGCPITNAVQPYILQKFVTIVSLPTTTQGYFATWTANARNNDVYNLDNPGGQSMSLYCTMAPPSLPNSSPVFASEAVALICVNDTTTLLNNAVDADGDRLVYSFGQPYGNLSGGATPPSVVPYAAANPASGTFSVSSAMGTTPGNFAIINQATGTAKYGSTLLAKKYVVAIDVSEYRTIGSRQVLIGVTR